MKQPSGLHNGIRSAGLLAIIILGLVSIIGTGGNGSYTPADQQNTYYRDADGDGYGDPNTAAEFTDRPLGEYISDHTDCDDGNAAVNPGATELCDDGIDNNCDGKIDTGCICTDDDSDGYYAEIGCGTGKDCNDADAAIHPGVTEVCWDNIDNNCNGLVDEGCTCTDADADGFYLEGDCGTAVDCDDTDAGIFPGATEICGDGKDNDCDGQDQWCGAGDARVPDTGQTICYNSNGGIIDCPATGRAFYGQDASYVINPPSYTWLIANGEAMVRDNVTGLIWEVKSDAGGIHDKDNRYAWNVVDSFIDQLNTELYGGYNDWRLPTRKELMSIVDYGAYGPAADTYYFQYTMSSYYWSSNDSGYNTTSGICGVNFISGQDSTSNLTDQYYVRAVRGQVMPASLTDNMDGTITDNGTGLMWAKASAAGNMTWREALSWCENLSLAGYRDWRLPTIKELKSLVDDTTDGMAIDVRYFPDTTATYYWSSTTHAYYTGHAWLVSFSYGNNGYGNKSGRYYVRAVRGGQGWAH